MKNIIINFKSNRIIKGTYYGQPFSINLNTKEDDLGILANDEEKEVISFFEEKSLDKSSMIGLNIGSIVKVVPTEGGEFFQYELKVTSIEEQGSDEDGNYFCVAYGEGVTSVDKKLAEDFTSRIEPLNFGSIITY